MDDIKNRIEKYLKDNGKATIPEMQLKFNLKFSEIAPAIRTMCEANTIALVDDYYYRLVQNKTLAESLEESRRRLEELRRRFTRNAYRKWPPDNDKEDEDEPDDEDEEDDDNDSGKKQKSGYDYLLQDDDDDDDEEEEEEDDDDEDEEDSDDYDYVKRRRLALEQKRQEMIKRINERRRAAGEDVEEDGDDPDEITESTAEEQQQEEQQRQEEQLQEQQRQEAARKDAIEKLDITLNQVNPVPKLINTLNEINPAQRLVDDLNAINPLARLASVIDSIAAKTAYRQSELYNARKRLANVLHNIAAGMDDRLRNGGRSYSGEYFSSFVNMVKTYKTREGKYEITADNVCIADRQPFKIYLIFTGNKTYLSDDGLVYSLLSRRLGDSRAERKMQNHTKQKQWLKYESKKLLLPTSLEHPAEDYFRMYYAMLSLLESF